MSFASGSWGLVVAGFVISAGLGCGGGGKGGGAGSFSTSVPSNTKLTSLTPSQAQQLCDDLDSYAARTLATSGCKETGFEAALLTAALDSQATDADLQAACQQAYDSCLQPPDGGATTSTTSCDPSSFTTQPATCQATVADLSACESDINAAYQQAFASTPSCDALTANMVASYLSSDGGASTVDVSEPASCSKFDSTCNTMAP